MKAGTVLILLAGRFRGRRVVLLKRDSKGALIVTGPYKVNGVPIRRVDPAYVIATSTQVCSNDSFNSKAKNQKKAKTKPTPSTTDRHLQGRHQGDRSRLLRTPEEERKEGRGGILQEGMFYFHPFSIFLWGSITPRRTNACVRRTMRRLHFQLIFSLPSSPHPQGAEKTELPADKKKAQSTVDDQILKAVAKNEDMVKYLAATFTLRDRDVPHTMKF